MQASDSTNSRRTDTKLGSNNQIPDIGKITEEDDEV